MAIHNADRQAAGTTTAAGSPATRVSERPARPAAGWASPRFWTCLTLLGAAAVLVEVVPPYVGWFFRKEAVPLQRPLQHLDVRKLGPRFIRDAKTDTLAPLGEDMIDTLGTRDYVQLYLTDTARPRGAPDRLVHLFITYYTGRPDQVPHVPDECYIAGGWERVGASTAAVQVPDVGAPDDQLPIRVLQFRTAAERRAATGASQVLTVVYFFHANGGYATTRNGVRTRLMNPLERFAYYAKVEINYPRAAPLEPEENRTISLAALEPLLSRLLPVLFKDHFDLSHFPGAWKGAAANE